MLARELIGNGGAAIATDLLGAKKALRCRATGASMRPFLPCGSVLRIEPDPIPGLGDIVLLKAQGQRLLVHRVVRARRTDGEGVQFLTRGDSATQVDGWTPAEMVYGRVTRVEYGRMVARADALLWRAAGLVWNHLAYRLRRLRSRVTGRLRRTQ